MKDGQGQVFIRRNKPPSEISHYLLMSRAKGKLSSPPIFEFKKWGINLPFTAPAAGLNPLLLLLQSRHQNLLCSNRLHLFPNDVFDLAMDPPTQRQKGVNPGEKLIDVARFDQKFMRGRLGGLRNFPKSLAEKLRISHQKEFNITAKNY